MTIRKKIASETSIPYKQVKTILDTLYELIAIQVKNHGRIYIPGLGSFYLKTLTRKYYRNPRTGEIVECPARQIIRFRPSIHLRRKVGTAPGK